MLNSNRKSTANILHKSIESMGLEWGTLRKCEDDALESTVAPMLDPLKTPKFLG